MQTNNRKKQKLFNTINTIKPSCPYLHIMKTNNWHRPSLMGYHCENLCQKYNLPIGS